MTSPTIGLFPRATEQHSITDFAVQAEKRGYDSVWIGEGWEHDLFVKLTEIATTTGSITLGSGIANVYTRTPTVLAMAAANLARLSDGRFVLGLGASHPSLVEQYHGIDYNRPLQRTREAIEIINLLLGDQGTISYDGDEFNLDGVPTQDVSVQVYNAALGTSNRRLTGRYADGWIPYGIPLPALETAHADVEMGRANRGRGPGTVTSLPYVTAAVSEDGEAARESIRHHIVTFVSRFDAYQRAFAQEYPDVISVILDAVEEGAHADAVEHITPEIVSNFGIAGTPEQARTQTMAVLERSEVDGIVLATPRSAGDEIIETTVDELAPDRF